MALFRELSRRNVFKVAAAYAIVGWLLMQVAATAFPALQLPAWTVTFVAALLIILFPVALLLAWAYELTPEGIRLTPSAPADGERPGRHPGLAYFATAVVAGTAGAAILWLASRDTDAEWLRAEAIPAIEADIDAGDWEAAYITTKEAEARVPGNPELAELWPRFSWRVTIPSSPAGATVLRRGFNTPDTAWETLGRTPIEQARIPFGLSDLRIELDGYVPLAHTIGGGGLIFDEVPASNPASNDYIVGTETFKLDTADTLPDGKVRVPGWSQVIDGELVELRDFFLDRYEVTNAQFKAFIDAGGYGRRNLWDPIVREGMEVPWDEAVGLFVDSTGRPGPSTWVAGDFPEGEADYPVSGVSWYEASAYARFVGQELPTVHHWRRAQAGATLPWLIPLSNLESSGPRAVGESKAMSYTGAFDLAGNVREWSWTARGGQHAILGGSFDDPTSIAMDSQRSTPLAPSLNRARGNGFRLAITDDAPAVAARARAPQLEQPPPPERDPVPAEIYAAYGRVFAYENKPLNATVDATEETRVWTRQRISFDAAYGDERMVLYLYLPKTGSPPFQTVVYWPGSASLVLRSIDEHSSPTFDFVVKSGRALAFPVYLGTFERGDRTALPPAVSMAYRDNAVAGIKDLRRSIDYLETRTDIDRNALAYYGYSWGGVNGPTALAQEPRLRLAVILTGFVPGGPMSPEVDPVNALPRIDVPVLMLSGEFDSIVPLENARRYFELIGTQAPEKKHVIASGGHFVPREELIRETLDWLDAHFGRPSGS
jgi:dienelactone hydrolase